MNSNFQESLQQVIGDLSNNQPPVKANYCYVRCFMTLINFYSYLCKNSMHYDTIHNQTNEIRS
jgi:hypothetical protein